jgi:two-component system sensor histidine kinase KdpD
VTSWRADGGRLLVALGGLGVITAAYVRWLHVTNDTSAALSFLVVVLFAAASSRLWVPLVTSAVAALTYDYFFLPPVGMFNITDPQDWYAFTTFVIVSVVASSLSAMARRRHHEALGRRDELGRLFELSRDVLVTTGSADAIPLLAHHIASRFRFGFVAICLDGEAGAARHEAGTLDRQDALKIVEFRQHGSQLSGRLEVAGRSIEPGTLDALASLVAIAVERIQLQDVQKRAEIAQRGIELKSALLASLAHDLRTPVTAIRLAVNNLSASQLTDLERTGQADVALAGVERLARLFQNILEMTQIDAGAVAPMRRWVYPSEVVAAARSQADQPLRHHHVHAIDRSDGKVVYVDPRLTSAILAHLLENAADYSPRGSTVTLTDEVVADGLLISVLDEGAGIAPAELPHVFERFYRGAQAHRHVSGTGMGLAIVQGLLAAMNGRVWAENGENGGARFSAFVPAKSRAPLEAD